MDLRDLNLYDLFNRFFPDITNVGGTNILELDAAVEKLDREMKEISDAKAGLNQELSDVRVHRKKTAMAAIIELPVKDIFPYPSRQLGFHSARNGKVLITTGKRKSIAAIDDKIMPEEFHTLTGQMDDLSHQLSMKEIDYSMAKIRLDEYIDALNRLTLSFNLVLPWKVVQPSPLRQSAVYLLSPCGLIKYSFDDSLLFDGALISVHSRSDAEGMTLTALLDDKDERGIAKYLALSPSVQLKQPPTRSYRAADSVKRYAKDKYLHGSPWDKRSGAYLGEDRTIHVKRRS